MIPATPFIKIFKVTSKILVVFIACITLCFSLNSCTKPGDDTPDKPTPAKPCKTCWPEITTTGKNTFGCKINGEIWLPEGDEVRFGTSITYVNEGLTVGGYNSKRDEWVNLSAKPIYDTGYYDFSKVSFTSSRGLYNNLNKTKDYRGQPVTKGYYNILRFDLEEGIVSGTFEFDAYGAQGDTVHITEGRFDLHF